MPANTPPIGSENDSPHAPGLQNLFLSVEVKSGIWINADLPHYPKLVLAPRVILATAILLLLTLLVSWFFIRRISRPFLKFAQAADKLGRGETPERLSQAGPLDVTLAATAFNTMQDRLTRLIESQRFMLRAVGHDLRTPLTAMRLDVEELEDADIQDKLITSIDEMTVLTADMLSWAKDLSGLEALASVNIVSFISSITEDYSVRGYPVSFQEPCAIIINIRRVAMKRALQNLINNGLKYGERVSIHIDELPNLVRVNIDDIGPGIPEADIANVLNPFVRLETSRNKNTGGTGLGLSIAKSISKLTEATYVS